jgi:hypothetical protein
MSNVIYYNIPAILEAAGTLEARVAMIDTILTGMETAMLTATTTGQFEEYKLDTGQTKNEVRYRSIGELQKAYEGLLKIQQMLLTRINASRQGRVIRMVDGKNFI